MRKKIAIWLIIFSLFTGWLIVQDLALDGQLNLLRLAGNSHSQISHFYPAGRINFDYQDGYAVERLVAEPVYVDVRVPRLMKAATVKISYLGQPQNVRIGVRLPSTNSDAWRYRFGDVVLDNATQTLQTNLDLEGALVERGRLRLIVASQHPETIAITKVQIEFSGEPLTLDLIMSRLAKRWQNFGL